MAKICEEVALPVFVVGEMRRLRLLEKKGFPLEIKELRKLIFQRSYVFTILDKMIKAEQKQDGKIRTTELGNRYEKERPENNGI